MRVYYFDKEGGNCGLIAAASLRAAAARARRLYGALDIVTVRRATEQDAQYVASMGGYVPEGLLDPAEKEGDTE